MNFHRSTFVGNPKQRYEDLNLREALNDRSKYPGACRELAEIIRDTYSKVPKSLQTLMFLNTISAFQLLPVMPTETAVASAYLLLQRAEFAFPKEKKALAAEEYYRAVFASERQSKSLQEQEQGQGQDESGISECPEDVLSHVFSYLDLPSLVSAGMVSRSWNKAANDGLLWKSLCRKFGFPKRFKDVRNDAPWKDRFKRIYKWLSSKKGVAPYRGYCKQCKTLVWLNDSRCYKSHRGGDCKIGMVFPVSTKQIATYVLHGSFLMSYMADNATNFLSTFYST